MLALRPSARTPTLGAESAFLNLPLEIRLLIYDELLVQPDELIRTFCTCRFCAHLQSPPLGRDCLNPSLLRTNKAILTETLPILYSKNVFLFSCYGPFTYVTRMNFSRLRRNEITTMERAGTNGSPTGPLANRDSPWAGVARINKCPSDSAKPHVRRLFLRLDYVYHRVLESFPNQWWYAVESDVLRFFPGLEQIVVQISVKQIRMLAFTLVFRRKDLIPPSVEDYKSILARAASLHPSAGEDLRNLETVFDEIVVSQTQGELKHCRFGAITGSWTHLSFVDAEDVGSTEKIFSVRLGRH